MPKQLFISYSTDDASLVATLREHLERQGIDCWMAPRDIVPGKDYAEQIIDAIEEAKILVLVLSESSNRSIFVRNEVERAVAKQKVIIPFRIQPVVPSRSLEFFISVWQWVDAWEPPLDSNLDRLVAAVLNHLEALEETDRELSGDGKVLTPPAIQPGESTQQPMPPFLIDPGLADDGEAIAARCVAREREIVQLEGFLAPALRGRGQVVFLTGEAGSGKSTLMQEFIRRAQQSYPDLVVAFGVCNAYAGIDDPYLPFREVLALLSGDIEDSFASGLITRENATRLWSLIPTTAQVLAEQGPDLVGNFIPGRPLVARAARFGSGHSRWLAQLQELTRQSKRSELERGRLFSQYTDVLQEIAGHQPVLLALDDLQWADASSISLLFHLARSIGGSRILIVGAYRTEDIALGRNGERHPLEDVINELRRQHGDIGVHLSHENESAGRQFVDALIDTEPNKLDGEFRQTLHRHTGGHPLFTVELLRDLQERGILVQDGSGSWVKAQAVDWKNLPPKVAGVIEQRIGRLDDETRGILSVASVEGLEFTAEVVAQVHGIDTRQMLRTSTQLEKRHRVIRSQGEVAVISRYLSRYRFGHALIQQHLYGELGSGERRLLHGEIADALELLYAGESDEVAVQLSRHYAEAGIQDKAIAYLLRAGDRAERLSAGLEALRHYELALKMAQGEESYHAILARRAKVFVTLFRGKEAVSDYERLLEQARRSGNRVLEMDYLLGLVEGYYLVALDDETGSAAYQYRDLCTTAQAVAAELDDKRYQALALISVLGFIDFWPGRRQEVEASAKEALRLSQELGDELLILDCKMGVICSALEWEQAQIGDSVVEELVKRRDLVRLNRTYFYLMWTYYNLGNFERAVAFCDAGIELAARLDVPPVQYPTLRAFSLLGLGRYREAWQSLQQEIADEAHPFGRTFRDCGIALYLTEVATNFQAADLFEEIVDRADQLRRSWLRETARVLAARSLILACKPGDDGWARAAKLIGEVDQSVLQGLSQLEGWSLQVQAEMALAEGRLDEASALIENVVSHMATLGYQADHLAALELQARLLLQLQRPDAALASCEEAYQLATAIENLPMVWRTCATRAQALETLGARAAADLERERAREVILKLAATIEDGSLREGYLADPLKASIIATVDAR